MGTVRLCAQELSETPYRVEATGLPIYSMEELAYYLYENIYLIDDSIMDETLYAWLEREAGMPELASRLRGAQGASGHVYNQVMTILQAAAYHTKGELSALSERIQKISGLQLQERLKHKADELLRGGSFWAAAAEYERILAIRQSGRLPVEFYAAVWANLGCCYAGLFLFEKAAECFDSAYQFHKEAKYRERAYYARRLAAVGQETMESPEAGEMPEAMLEQAEYTLKELEQESLAACEQCSAEEFLKLRIKRFF